MNDPEDVLQTVADWLARGRQVCIATVIARRGSGPREVGAKMAVSLDGEISGSIGGGGLEQMVIAKAREILRAGEPSTVELDLSGQASGLDAMCGGQVTVFLEPVGRRRRLFVIGAGHVGKAVAWLASRVGFAVTVVDDRPDALAGVAEGGGVSKTLVPGPAEAEGLGIDASAHVVVCTRGHSQDKEWLERMLAIGPRYLGMLGSRHKVAAIFDELTEKGFAADAMRKVRSPVGLDIGAVTPEEIAVSIVGQLVKESRRPGAE
jgi:xanthine dehydrogenase accessory factor